MLILLLACATRVDVPDTATAAEDTARDTAAEPEAAPPSDFALADTERTWVGASADEKVGWALAALGDLDGDGVDELAVAGPRHRATAEASGAVYVGSGAADRLLDTVRWTGTDFHHHAGTSLARAGDSDGDGLSELLVGAAGGIGRGVARSLLEPPETGFAGAAYLLATPRAGGSLADADAVYEGEEAGDFAGCSVAGELEGVGVLAIGAYRHADAAGAVYLVEASVRGTRSLAEARTKLVGVSPGDYAGTMVASLGDVDGDGLGDLLIGADGRDTHGDMAGAAYLVSDPGTGTISLADADAELLGEAAEDYAGMAVGAAGDLDGDGLADFLVGAGGADVPGGRQGMAAVWLTTPSGTVGLHDADATLLGEDAQDYSGVTVGSAGDVDLDGRSELFVSSDHQDGGGVDAGAVYVLLDLEPGEHRLGDAGVKLVGAQPNDRTGEAVVAAHLDPDGVPDLAVGAAYADAGGDNAGLVYLLSGLEAGW